MRWGLIIAALVMGAGGWYVWNNPRASDWINEKVPSKELSTLEIRFTADQIVEKHRREIQKSESHVVLEPKLTYLPYLWMDVKYAKDSKSTEAGISLWSMIDGEMVLNAQTWEKTHGYEDCLVAKADAQDFNVLNTVAAHGGSLLRENLYHSSSLESKLLDKAVSNCQKKKLLVVKNDLLRLHVDQPKFAFQPITVLNEDFVHAATKSAHRESKKYSSMEIKKLAENAFGTDFTIRNTKEIFVPFYTISIKNPDGSLLVTQWNALTGERLKK